MSNLNGPRYDTYYSSHVWNVNGSVTGHLPVTAGGSMPQTGPSGRPPVTDQVLTGKSDVLE